MRFKMEARRTSDGPTGPVIETEVYESNAELLKALWGSADQQYYRKVTNWATQPTTLNLQLQNGAKFTETWIKMPEGGDTDGV